ncbi:MAG: hypothetical protein KC620_20450, partial [Myxococcales bacterium]|nr:hypothetical protein [Myxococcales bacterium]
LIADKWSAFLMAVIADNDWRPTIATTSWLIPERDYYAAYGSRVITSLLDQCAALGITVLSAAGDWGAYDGIPRTMTRGARVSDATWPRAVFPAVEERVLGVGGTMVTHREPLTEVTWSGPLPPGFATDAPVTRLASGGGFSAEVPIPDWQEHFLVFNESERIYRTYSRGPNAPAVMAYGRGVPDVSIMAVADAVQRSPTEPLTARGYRALVNGRWIDFAGGTSTGAPIWAALLARINQACQAAGLRRVGFVNPLLYHLVRYADEYNRKPYLREEDKLPKPFRDIISGRSDVTLRALDGACMPVQVELPGFEATGSWDPATGLGVPIGTRLLDAIVAHGHDLRRRAAEAAAVGEGEGR